MHERRTTGFTLIEVLLAMLLFSVGFFALFGIFPHALNQNKRSMDVTKAALFAESVNAGIQGNAMNITSWSVWTDPDELQSQLSANLWPQVVMDGTTNAVQFPSTNLLHGTWLRYRFDITSDASNIFQTIGLYIDMGTNGPFDDELFVFPIGVFYMGNPQ